MTSPSRFSGLDCTGVLTHWALDAAGNPVPMWRYTSLQRPLGLVLYGSIQDPKLITARWDNTGFGPVTLAWGDGTPLITGQPERGWTTHTYSPAGQKTYTITVASQGTATRLASGKVTFPSDGFPLSLTVAVDPDDRTGNTVIIRWDASSPSDGVTLDWGDRTEAITVPPSSGAARRYQSNGFYTITVSDAPIRKITTSVRIGPTPNVPQESWRLVRFLHIRQFGWPPRRPVTRTVSTRVTRKRWPLSSLPPSGSVVAIAVDKASPDRVCAVAKDPWNRLVLTVHNINTGALLGRLTLDPYDQPYDVPVADEPLTVWLKTGSGAAVVVCEYPSIKHLAWYFDISNPATPKLLGRLKPLKRITDIAPRLANGDGVLFVVYEDGTCWQGNQTGGTPVELNGRGISVTTSPDGKQFSYVYAGRDGPGGLCFYCLHYNRGEYRALAIDWFPITNLATGNKTDPPVITAMMSLIEENMGLLIPYAQSPEPYNKPLHVGDLCPPPPKKTTSQGTYVVPPILSCSHDKLVIAAHWPDKLAITIDLTDPNNPKIKVLPNIGASTILEIH